jgi:hypothetical protein
MKEGYAPIVLFTYCRPNNTKETIKHLLMNEEAKDSDLFIYSDSSKNEKADDGVRRTREYIRSISGFKSVSIIEREKNMGLANNIVDGVTSIINQYGKVIVLEDDLSVSPFFLRFMNEGLERYKDRDDIISIHGYVYPTKKKLPEAFLIKGADCWGWATWKRGWDMFCFDATLLYKKIKESRRDKEFDYNFSYPYMDMLKRQMVGIANSWAICWYASAFLNNMYTLYPSKSLVQLNDLVGNGSTHGSTPMEYLVEVRDTPINWNLVDDKKESKKGRVAFEKFFNSQKSLKKNLIISLKRRIKIILYYLTK